MAKAYTKAEGPRSSSDFRQFLRRRRVKVGRNADVSSRINGLSLKTRGSNGTRRGLSITILIP